MFLTLFVAIGVILMPINGGKTTRWTGAVDTAWATAGNWSNGVPASNNTTGLADTVIIDKTATRGILSGTDRTGDDAAKGLRIYEFLVEPGSNVPLGTSAAPLQFNWATAVMQGNENVYLSSSYGSVSQASTRTIIDAPTTDKAVWFKAKVGGTASGYTRVEAINGLTHIQDATIIDCHVSQGLQEVSVFPIVVINGSTAHIESYWQTGGRTLIKSADLNSLIFVGGGLVEVNGPITSSTVPLLYMSGGGIWKYLVVPSGSQPNPIQLLGGSTLDLESVTGLTLASVTFSPLARLKKGTGNTITSEVEIGTYPYP